MSISRGSSLDASVFKAASMLSQSLTASAASTTASKTVPETQPMPVPVGALLKQGVVLDPIDLDLLEHVAASLGPDTTQILMAPGGGSLQASGLGSQQGTTDYDQRCREQQGGPGSSSSSSRTPTARACSSFDGASSSFLSSARTSLSHEQVRLTLACILVR